MAYLVDTNIWSFLQRRSSPLLLQRFAALPAGSVYLSAVVRGELETGYEKGDKAAIRRVALDAILRTSIALNITHDVALAYARIRAKLERAGTPIGPNDTWIAAEALHHGLILITDNTLEFNRVDGLRVENWLD